MGKVNDGETRQPTVSESGGKTGNTGNPTAGTSKTGGTGGRGAAGTKSKQKDIVPKLVMVDVPETTEEPKKKRGRPKGSGTKKKAAAKKSGEVDAGQLKMLLMTTTAIIASRPGMEDFMLSEQEADQICAPLSNIMARSEGVAGVAGEYADHIALVIACFTIFVPKFLMWKSKQPKKEVKKNAIKPVRELPKQGRPKPEPERSAEGTSKGLNSAHAERSGESNGKEFGGSLHQLIPFGGF
ncbi:hypothetical protein [Bacillus licheniformis]|uniref:hypothetical protein n=1 Tax=Bacillus licheniformis TaxID=1402 RepID=UPI00119E5897|nr:hypothetical protein [Bacillus licheniformis]